ncbi:MAG: aminotransferase class III-fold pyridoxal phosphate-dependent enzyme, partial [Polaromonas sp.]
LLANAVTVGDHLKAALTRELGSLPGLKEIRGRGLMLGVELALPCSELVERCAANGLLISVTADTVIRLVPSLIMSIAEADEVVGILCPLILQLLKEKA